MSQKKLEKVNSIIIQKGLSPELYYEQKYLKEEWEELCSREEIYWRKKSHELWLRDGNKNTIFFHETARVKRAVNTIFSIKHSESGHLIEDDNGIKEEGVRFFSNLLAPPHLDPIDDNLINDFISCIPPLITADHNRMLLAPFTLEEIKKVVSSFPPDKAPGPDGFTALFYQKCWDFIGSDLLAVVEESRRNAKMIRSFNSTNIAIIPKVKQPTSFADFRPISLCNMVYKLITKAIYMRLQKFIPHIISLDQGGFVPGRETWEGVVVAHETLHSINSHQLSSFVIKLDMMKAYDRVRWLFLFKVISKFGFSDKWCRWIKNCISGAWFSVIVNGESIGFFPSSQGIR